MKLYKFCFTTYGENFNKYVLEVEEKPKTYMTTEAGWRTRINKSDIGIVDSYDNVYLLEDDEKKAREIFCDRLNSEIEREKSKIEDSNKRIKRMEEIIKKFSGAED